MPRSRTKTNDGQFTLTYKTLGGIVSLLAVVGVLYGAISRVATKDDVKELATTYGQNYQAIENRVRNLEIQFASFFGKSNTNPTSLKVTPSDEETEPAFTLVQYEQSQQQGQQRSYSAPVRRVVVTGEFIKVHDLQPTKGGAYGLLGEDGQFYSLDDVMAILVREHNESAPRLDRFERMKK